ncbi:MAG: hypothetical protein EXR75_05225 [Myxococcales bacterium]|nr:hypothetical protein [Myxococcales bacterium]
MVEPLQHGFVSTAPDETRSSRTGRARALVALFLLGAGANACVTYEGFYLNQICGSVTTNFDKNESYSPCTVSGDASEVSGATADSVAYRFGPKTGALHIRLSALPIADEPTWTAEVLAVASRPEGSTLFRELTWGSCGAECPTDPGDASAPVTTDLGWAQLIDGVAGPGRNFTAIPEDAILTLRGANINLYDLRWETPVYEY